MSKTLILFRHAKSDWDSDNGTDHDRPLATRGVKAAAAMGKFLAEVGHLPELAISSTALRAMTTLKLAKEAGNWPCETRLDKSLYNTDPSAVMRYIAALPSDVQSVMLVGHETTWSELTALLTGGGNVRFPTGAMVRMDFAAETWASVQPNSGELVWFVPPRFVTEGQLKL
ncbi:MAG: SixA phosphatase family protein [Limisphaerales bacterium]